MKFLAKAVVILSVFICGTAIAQNAFQKEKLITLTLTVKEVETLYDIVDYSRTDGEIRKPLLQKIAQQFQAQTDTTNRKK